MGKVRSLKQGYDGFLEFSIGQFPIMSKLIKMLLMKETDCGLYPKGTRHMIQLKIRLDIVDPGFYKKGSTSSEGHNFNWDTSHHLNEVLLLTIWELVDAVAKAFVFVFIFCIPFWRRHFSNRGV